MTAVSKPASLKLTLTNFTFRLSPKSQKFVTFNHVNFEAGKWGSF